MKNAYNEATPFLSDAKNSTGFVSNAAADFINAGKFKEYLPKTMQLFQQTKGLQSELVQQQQDPLQDTRFLSLPKEQASMCSVDAIGQLGAMPEWERAPARDEKNGSPQLPPKNILFEACMTNQPLNASLRETWSTGTYYFLK